MTADRFPWPVRSSCARPPGSAFTLVELLVVVAIVALLVSMLVPSLTTAREHAKAAACRNNLRQLYKVFHAASPGRLLELPSCFSWVDHIRHHEAGGALICPNDEYESFSGAGLEELYLVQYDGSTWYYPLPAIIDSGGSGFFQCQVFERSDNVIDIWIGNYWNTTDLAGSDADGAVRIILGGGSITIMPLDAPGKTHCGSEHWVCRGTCGTSNWKSEVLVRLTGNAYRTVDAAVEVPCLPVSYGMNNQVRPGGTASAQLLLLDYHKNVADVDGLGGSDDDLAETLAPRHLGKANVVCTDGHCIGLRPEDLDRTEDIWKP